LTRRLTVAQAIGDKVYNLSSACPPDPAAARFAPLDIRLPLTSGTASLAGRSRAGHPRTTTAVGRDAGRTTAPVTPALAWDGPSTGDPICIASKGGLSQNCCNSDTAKPCFPTAGGGQIVRMGKPGPPAPPFPDQTYPKTGSAVLAAVFCLRQRELSRSTPQRARDGSADPTRHAHLAQGAPIGWPLNPPPTRFARSASRRPPGTSGARMAAPLRPPLHPHGSGTPTPPSTSRPDGRLLRQPNARARGHHAHRPHLRGLAAPRPAYRVDVLDRIPVTLEPAAGGPGVTANPLPTCSRARRSPPPARFASNLQARR